jgi:hypothetical protein
MQSILVQVEQVQPQAQLAQTVLAHQSTTQLEASAPSVADTAHGQMLALPMSSAMPAHVVAVVVAVQAHHTRQVLSHCSQRSSAQLVATVQPEATKQAVAVAERQQSAQRQ